MLLGQPRAQSADNRAWIAGDLTPEELDEIGPEPTTMPPLSWTRGEYKAQMLRRGIVDACDEMGLGIDGYLALAEAVGILEKRPNMVDSTTFCSFVPSAREVTPESHEPDSFGSFLTTCFPAEFRRRGPA